MSSEPLTRPSALALYELGLRETEAGAGSGSVALHAVADDGTRRRLPLRRWTCAPEAAEEELLDRCAGPVLDVGCGAGRHLVALGARGVEAVGVEISPTAAAIAGARGAEVIEASIFERPLAGGWGTALLLDGNIGIGGDPVALLRRVAALLAPGGAALVELEPHAAASRAERVRLEYSRQVSEWIPWRFVSAGEIEPLAAAAALGLRELWCAEGRWFAELRLGETG